MILSGTGFHKGIPEYSKHNLPAVGSIRRDVRRFNSHGTASYKGLGVESSVGNGRQ